MELKSDAIASTVLGSSGGARVKRYFDIDTFNFLWIDLFLRDEILRKKIQTWRDDIQNIQKSPIHKDELRAFFQSAISSINNERLSWFVEMLKAVQARSGAMINDYIVKSNTYFPGLELSNKDIDSIFSQLPEEGVRQADIDSKIQQMQKKIKNAEDVIASELSPHDRWKYEDNGNPIPYPQGCQWTQYVNAWRKIAPRFEVPVSVEGLAIKNDSEQSAYIALGLNSIRKVSFRKPAQ